MVPLSCSRSSGKGCLSLSEKERCSEVPSVSSCDAMWGPIGNTARAV